MSSVLYLQFWLLIALVAALVYVLVRMVGMESELTYLRECISLQLRVNDNVLACDRRQDEVVLGILDILEGRVK